MDNLNNLGESVLFPIGDKLPEQFSKYFTCNAYFSIETNVLASRPEWLEPITDEE